MFHFKQIKLREILEIQPLNSSPKIGHPFILSTNLADLKTDYFPRQEAWSVINVSPLILSDENFNALVHHQRENQQKIFRIKNGSFWIKFRVNFYRPNNSKWAWKSLKLPVYPMTSSLCPDDVIIRQRSVSFIWRNFSRLRSIYSS